MSLMYLYNCRHAVVHVHLMNLNLDHKPSQTYLGHAVPI